jgi:Flp pilus assembly protein TadD
MAARPSSTCFVLFLAAWRFAGAQQIPVDDMAALEAHVRQSPEDSRANYNLGIAYFRQTRLKDARPFLDKATALSPREPETWMALSLVLLGLNDFTGAAGPLQHACDLAPASGNACYLQGRNLFLLGRYDEAVKPLEKAMRSGAAEDQAKIERAAALNFDKLGNAADAERHFHAAIRLYRPQERAREDPRLDYGAFLVRQGRAAEAIDPLQQSLKAFPLSPQASAELGRALLDLDRPQDALPRLQKAVEIDSGAWAVRMLLGKTYLRLGRSEEGERELRRAREGWAIESRAR